MNAIPYTEGNALWDFFYAHRGAERALFPRSRLAVARSLVAEVEASIEAKRRRIVIDGVAVPWDTPAPIGDTFHEFRRGALAWDASTALLVGGHRGIPVAFSGHRLRLWNGDAGLEFRAELPDTPAGRAAASAAARASGISIGWLATDWHDIGARREIRAAILEHIAILQPPARPAFAGTRVAVRRSTAPNQDRGAPLAQGEWGV